MGTTDQLVERAKQGDAAAYEALFARVAPRLLTFIELRLGPTLRGKLEPLDILQDAYLDAHRSFERFEPRGHDAFLRWLYRIIDHTILDQADRFGTQKRAAAEAPAVIEALRGALTGPSTKAARAEEQAVLLEAMGRLEERDRRLLLAHHFQGQTTDEVAAALGQTPRHARRLLRAAEARLGEEVERLRGTPPPAGEDTAPAMAELGAQLLDRCARPPAPAHATPPGRIGRYVVQGELGRGGVGVVFRALDPERGVEVAVKLLGTQHEDARRRFVREARALTRLDHPGLVAALDVGEHEGAPYLVMPLVSGEDLQARLDRDGPLPVGRACALARQLALALDHAHAQGVLHRDVKPRNVVLAAEDRCVLTDFSLAKLTDVEMSQLSERGQQLGTEGYWPPEQARGALEAIGPASDVYGLGATLFAMLSGRPPIEGASPVARMRATLKDRPPPASSLRPDVPPALDAVCARCLEKDPALRFPSAAALAEALRSLEAP